MTEEVQNHLESLTNDFSEVANEKKDKLSAVESNLDSTSQEVLSALTQKFVEEAIRELTGSAEKVTEASSQLKEAGDEVNEVLGDRIDEILDKVDDVVAIVKKIEPVLEMVDDILG